VQEPGQLLATLGDWVARGKTPPDRLDHDVVVDTDTGARGQATWCPYPAFLQQKEATRPLCMLPGEA
jgi:hypothetical protein